MYYLVVIAALMMASTGTGLAATSKLRVNPEWATAVCELPPPLKADASPEERQKARDASERLTTLRRLAPEFKDGYQPAAYELFEALRAPLPCDKRIKAPAGFRCRLDRVRFKDEVSGQIFSADAASYAFSFAYYDAAGAFEFTDKPRPIAGRNAPGAYGEIIVRGKFRGKTAYLVQNWIKGTPSYLATSTEEMKSFKPLRPAQVPIVTAENFVLYVTEIPEGPPYSAGPLLRTRLAPHSCARRG